MNIKRAIIVATILLAIPAVAIEKDWKGQSPDADFTFGVMAGAGILDSTVGFGLPVHIAKKIVNRGFSPDMNNQVFLEAQAGPLFISGSTAFQYSLHLRWDFVKDMDWSFYGLGGVGGIVCGSSLGNRTIFYPRFGMGAVWNLFEHVSLRAELSHEFLGAGVLFPF